MSDLSVSIQPLTLLEIPQAMALKDAEGWNQTPKDWELFIKTDPSLCLSAKVGGKLVGTVTGISFENRVAWISMMLVNKEYRGRGISKLLLKEIIRRLDGCASIKLDATPAGYPVYESLGFKEEFSLARYTLDLPAFSSHQLGKKGALTCRLSDLRDVVSWDTNFFGANRGKILTYLHSQAKNLAKIAGQPQSLQGYVLGRPGTRFTQIGPLVALEFGTAKALLLDALAQVIQSKVLVDVCQHQDEMVQLLEELGFVKQRDLYRMYLKGNPHPAKSEHYFLAAGPELG